MQIVFVYSTTEGKIICLSWLPKNKLFEWKIVKMILLDIISFFIVCAITSVIMYAYMQCRNKLRDRKGGNILQNHSQTNQRSGNEQWHLVHPFFSVSDCWGHYYNAKISSTAQPTTDLRGKETSWLDHVFGCACVWERLYKKKQDCRLIFCGFVYWCCSCMLVLFWCYSYKDQLCIN